MTGARRQHAYQACRDGDCQRFACRVYREGYRNGRDDGKAEGHAEGYVKGHTAGYAEGPHRRKRRGPLGWHSRRVEGVSGRERQPGPARPRRPGRLGGVAVRGPFGRCPKCGGTGHVKSGKRRVKVCPRCKGRRRVQRTGSRTVHRLARRIRQGRQAAARYQQEDDS